MAIPNFEAQRERISSLYLFSTIRFATILSEELAWLILACSIFPREADFCSIYFNEILFEMIPSAVKTTVIQPRGVSSFFLIWAFPPTNNSAELKRKQE